MKVLHLFSNSKWTGPAEPALLLCSSLRGLGLEADFACAPGGGRTPNKIVETARDLGIEPILDLRLEKHRNPVWNLMDRARLKALLDKKHYDLVHCHLDNDHRIAAPVAARAGVPLVRSSYEGTGFQRGEHMRLLYRTAALIEPSEMAKQHDCPVYVFSPGRTHVVPAAVDVARFDPQRETPDGRRRLNLPPQALVVGIVARMQPHRHYDDLFEAFRLLLEDVPDARLIVVGRGSNQEEVARRPVRELGIEASVHFPGYLDSEDYVGMLRAFDIGVFLTPGTDGTCRAVREMMAMAKPVVAADRGMLREIVEHEQSGLVCAGSAGALHQTLLRLARDRQERHRFGQAARARAVEAFAPEVQARSVLAIYEGIQQRDG